VPERTIRNNETRMSESAAERQQKLVNELRATANLMTLDAGLFCIVSNPSRAANVATGLPGVRVSLPPGAAGRPEAVSIATFRDDGWLGPFGDAALVRVTGGPAHILITVYQAPDAPEGGAPNVQVIRLTDTAARWIEGFAIAPSTGIDVADIEYQAVLGRDWLSPWVDGGQFCGSRGMALPLLGFRLRLRGKAAETMDCTYTATFVDGSICGPVDAGEACQAESLAALESVLISVTPRHAAPASVDEMPAPAKPATKKAAAPKPAPSKPARGAAKSK
jgi:hypothetical protein